jgi:hypothetical protein
MTDRIVFGSKVEADLIESYDYYEEQLSVWGPNFYYPWRPL